MGYVLWWVSSLSHCHNQPTTTRLSHFSLPPAMSLVTEQLTLAERGRIPAHQKHMLELYALLLAAKRARRPREKAAALRVIQVIMFGLVLHGASYDNVYRPATLGMLPPIMQPWLAFSPMIVRDHTGFDPLDFTQLCGLLSLLPAFIVTSNRRRVSRQYAVYVVLRRWSSTATWNGVVAESRMHRQTLVTIYTTTLGLLAHHYSVLVTVPDVARIIPLLPQWAANVHAFTGSTADRIVVSGAARGACLLPSCSSSALSPRTKTMPTNAGNPTRCAYRASPRIRRHRTPVAKMASRTGLGSLPAARPQAHRASLRRTGVARTGLPGTRARQQPIKAARSRHQAKWPRPRFAQ